MKDDAVGTQKVDKLCKHTRYTDTALQSAQLTGSERRAVLMQLRRTEVRKRTGALPSLMDKDL